MRQTMLVLTAVVGMVTAAPFDDGKCRGGAGVCVPYYNCVHGVVNASVIFETRISETEECPNILDTCCLNPITTTEKAPTELPTTKKAPTELPTTKKAPTELPTTEKAPTVSPTLYKSTCGKRNTQGIDVKIKDLQTNETQMGEFPWMAAVFKKKVVAGADSKFLCGGSLIHPSVVLTSASCVYQQSGVPSNLLVRLGEWDTQNEYESYKHQDVAVRSVVVHPDFRPINLKNDYALLYLEAPVVLSRNVDVICLTNRPLSRLSSQAHNCVVTGWGKDSFGEQGNYQNVLKRVDLSLVGSDQCQNVLRTTKLGQSFNLDISHLCAGSEEGKDSCTGDGGSPLVCLIGDHTHYVQVGIVSWGIGCGTIGVPGVYADVLHGYTWIMEQTANLLVMDGKPFEDYMTYV